MTRVFVWVVALACLSSVASAEEAKEPPAYPLGFKEAEGLPPGSKVSTWEGMAKPWPGDRFFTENLLVLQPIAVTVVAKHKGDKIHVSLAKMKWEEKHMEGETGPDKQKVILKTRTQGDFRIVITSPDGGEPKPYYLFVWVGAEHKPQLAPVTTSMKNYKGSGASIPGAPNAGKGGGSSTVGIVIAVLLGLILIVLVVMLKKRGAK